MHKRKTTNHNGKYVVFFEFEDGPDEDGETESDSERTETGA
jgi:hypothetical protein